MFTDVCIPNGNEEEFIDIAEQLETKAILFLYERKEKDLAELQKKTKVKLYSGILATKNPQPFQKICFGKAEQFNIENRSIRFLYGFEEMEPKDSFHFRRSGMNQVIGKQMKSKQKVFVIPFEKILLSKEQPKTIGRIQQNLMLVRKYKLDLIICSFATDPMHLRAKEELASFIRALGYQEEAKKATETLALILSEH